MKNELGYYGHATHEEEVAHIEAIKNDYQAMLRQIEGLEPFTRRKADRMEPLLRFIKEGNEKLAQLHDREFWVVWRENKHDLAQILTEEEYELANKRTETYLDFLN